MGRCYTLAGRVIKGNEIGRKIGYPTANVSVGDSTKIIPSKGIYIVEVELSSKIYKGIMSIGVNPTISDNNTISMEVHIIGLSKNIYGEIIKIYFKDYIRKEEKFNTLEELRTKITKDKILAMKFFKKHSNDSI